MMRLALLLCLQAFLATATLAQPPLQVDVDGQPYGAFASLAQDRDAGGTVTLEQGWVSAAFFGLWWPQLGNGLAPGSHRLPADCEGRPLEVNQALAPGDARGRLRSWSLIGACPLACEVEAQDDGKIHVTSLTLRVQGVAAAM